MESYEDMNHIISNFEIVEIPCIELSFKSIPEKKDGIIIYMKGQLEVVSDNSFREQISNIIDSGYITLIFQMDELLYSDGPGFDSFLFFLEQCKFKGGDMIMCNVNPNIYETYKLLGFTEHLNIQADIDSALQQLFNDEVINNIFPIIFLCPKCEKKYKATKSGRFRCGECKTIFAIDQKGKIWTSLKKEEKISDVLEIEDNDYFT